MLAEVEDETVGDTMKNVEVEVLVDTLADALAE